MLISDALKVQLAAGWREFFFYLGLPVEILVGRGLPTVPGNFKPIGIPVILNLLIRTVKNSTGNLPP